MTGSDPDSPLRSGAATDRPARAVPVSIADCRSCEPALREALEALDDEVRGVVNHLLAGVDGRGADGATFLKSATTVLLSIAAGLMETAAERGGEMVDTASFKDAAEDAAQWAKIHRLRHLLDNEG